MKVFHCDHCRQLLFFENTKCVQCGRLLAFIPDLGVVASLDPAENGLWKSPIKQAFGRRYKLCENYAKQNVCNWAMDAADPHAHCPSCRLTEVIPDLGVPGNKEAWCKLETAKRRLVYSLMKLQCPLASKSEDPEYGLAFEFLADPEGPDAKPVLTGHADGRITVNIAEADDSERERRRTAMHEQYRTLLGHFRHEVGHYYWDVLIKDGPYVDAFRKAFGDERRDYGEALEEHYKKGPPADWQANYISAYASCHPWEDWAETWAHYLHMSDTVETAVACGMSLKPRRADEPALEAATPANRPKRNEDAFQRLIDDWHPLTYVLNNLNRGLGLPDGYPFVLSAPVIAKLRFVHDVVHAPPHHPAP